MEFLNDNKELPLPYRGKHWAEPYNWNKETRSYPKGKSDHPVVLVAYEDAGQFCKWRSQKEGKKYRLPSTSQRLPFANDLGYMLLALIPKRINSLRPIEVRAYAPEGGLDLNNKNVSYGFFSHGNGQHTHCIRELA
jgi:hypothetical protein